MAQQLSSAIERRAKLHTIWGIICLTAPTALWIITFALAALSNLAFNSTVTQDSLFNDPSIAQVVIRIISFLFGALAFFTWLPGIIVGIILLTTKPRVQQ